MLVMMLVVLVVPLVMVASSTLLALLFNIILELGLGKVDDGVIELGWDCVAPSPELLYEPLLLPDLLLEAEDFPAVSHARLFQRVDQLRLARYVLLHLHFGHGDLW